MVTDFEDRDGTVGLSSRFFRDTLKIRHLRILVALDQMRHISKVAQAFNVSQPAISKQLAELRKELGSPIIRRAGGTIEFTPVGQMLVRHAKNVLQQLRRAEFDVEAFQKGLSGHVRVGAVASLLPSLIPEAARLMLRGAPLARITVSEGHFNRMLPALRGGELDLIVTRIWKPMSLERIEQLSLGFEPMVVVAGRGHPLVQETNVDWEMALQWPWLRASSDSIAAEAFDASLMELGHQPIVGQVEATSIPLILRLLQNTQYLALLPDGVAREHSARGDLSVLPLEFGDTLSEARCFWLSDTAEETVSLFRECLLRASVELFSADEP